MSRSSSAFQKFIPDLLRQHESFRRLWLSQLISNFGDWFGVLAAYTLILQQNGSELMLGALIVTKMMSFALFSPFGGYLADRFNRRKLMIWTDIGRALVVSSFFLAGEPGQLWILFAGTAIQMLMSAVFEPSRSGIVPDMLPTAELARANVITSATWSIVFATGMGIGGLATEWLGVQPVFLINALSYLVSGYFIYRMKDPGVQGKAVVSNNPLSGIKEGYKYVRTNAAVRYPALVKASTSFLLGALVYALVLIGDEKLGLGAAGIGLLYASRGVGTAFGPVWTRFFFPHKSHWLSGFGLLMVISGVFYAFCGFDVGLGWILFFVFIAHAASAGSWVLSTVLVQERAEFAFRGRVSGLEWLSFTITNSISTLLAAAALEFHWLSLNALMYVFGGLLVLLGLLWMKWMTGFGEHPWWRKTVATVIQAP